MEMSGEAAGQYSSDDDDEEWSRKPKPKKVLKREQITATFTEEQEQELVLWLQHPERECVYNKKHRHYIKKGMQNKMWEEKAREMGKTTVQLKKWYVNMRSRFCKMRETSAENANLTDRDRWILEHFEFLRPYLMINRNKRTPVSHHT